MNRCTFLPDSSSSLLRFARHSPLASKYHIKKLLIESLFGGVVLCQDPKSGEQVAVKVSSHCLNYQQTSLKGESVCDDVEREVAILQYIANASYLDKEHSECTKDGMEHSHTEECHNIPAWPASFDAAYHLGGYVESFQTQSHHFLISRFARHGDLHDYVTRHGAFTEDRARHLFLQMCLAVKYLHSHHITHNDLSMENVALDSDDQIMLIDFGSAWMHPYAPHAEAFSEYPPPLTFADEVYQRLPNSSVHFPVRCNFVRCGKRGYISPELYGSHCVYDAYSNDVFALGVILYTILTAHPPFGQANSNDSWYNYISSGQWLQPENIKKQMEGKSGCVYSKLSKAALNLLDSILKPAVKRLTLDEILQHPWLQGESEMPSTSQAMSVPTTPHSPPRNCEMSDSSYSPSKTPTTEISQERKLPHSQEQVSPSPRCIQSHTPVDIGYDVREEQMQMHIVDLLSKTAITPAPSASIQFRRQSSYIAESPISPDSSTSFSYNCDHESIDSAFPQADLFAAHFNT